MIVLSANGCTDGPRGRGHRGRGGIDVAPDKNHLRDRAAELQDHRCTAARVARAAACLAGGTVVRRLVSHGRLGVVAPLGVVGQRGRLHGEFGYGGREVPQGQR
ncbi:hypothetical protein OG946_00250 [Streptomyces sp. NBC_01808]|uniref:hypothetical protein n=1 Tax=Streptomyces sp. NBC_01808 TaxID=2975947 RepID=UPI002DD908F1|nr:hypothetical protein [Streptomyces sp. NBC_01808]WSA35940.1 hypothetical protein OG946_00250 [Streptomyces sp. NBC_01808]